MKNVGAELVEYSIELGRQWMMVHKYLYGTGQEIISDARYDSSYQIYELEGEVVGHESARPPIPKYAKIKEESEHFDVPIWDHMEEFRRRNK